MPADSFNSIDIILDRIVLDGDSGFADQNFHQDCLVPALNDKSFQDDTAGIDSDGDPRPRTRTLQNRRVVPRSGSGRATRVATQDQTYG